MKKKTILRYGIVVSICMLLIIIFICMYNRKNIKEAGISRFEWIKMLTDEFGISEYSNNEPYYEDVNSDSEYFRAVQSAYEWGIIEKISSFKGEDIAEGKFIALTAMKAVGKYKVQIYLGLSKAPSEKEYLDLAVEEGLIEKVQLHKGLSEEEGQIVLERAGELYLRDFWENNVEISEYKDYIIEIDSKNIKTVNEDYSEIAVFDNLAEPLEAGDIIVFENPVTGQKSIKEIVSFKPDGSMKLIDASMDKALDLLIVSDISEVRFEDILAYYNMEEGSLADNGRKRYDTSLMKHIGGSAGSKGFSIHLLAEDNKLFVKLVDNNTGTAYKLPFDERVDTNDMEASINIKEIYAGVQTVWTAEEGVEYIDVQINADIECEGEISFINKEMKHMLTEFPIYLGGGIAEIKIKVYLVLSAEGSVSIRAELPVNTAVTYEKGAGVRRHSDNSEYPEADVTADCSAKFMIDLAPTVGLFCWDILDLECEAGLSANGEIKNRSNSNITACADVNIALPIVTVSVSAGEDAKRIFEKLFDKKMLEVEWEIYTKDNAPHKYGGHYEEYADGTSDFVKNCTYNGEEAGISTLLKSHIYMACFNSDFIDKGSYYETEGVLIDRAYIPVSTAEGMAINDVYYFDGIEFTLVDKETLPDRPSEEAKRYHFIDGRGNEYEAGVSRLGINGSREYYELEQGIEENLDDIIFFEQAYSTFIILDYNFKFEIPRDEAIEIINNMSALENTNSSGKFEKLTEITVNEGGPSYSTWILTPIDRPGVYVDADSLETVDIVSYYQ